MNQHNKLFRNDSELMAQMADRRAVRSGIALIALCAGLAISGCGEKPPEVRVAAGTVTRVQFAFAGWNDQSQVDAAGRSISVQGIAPIPVNTAVELRGSKDYAELLCVTGTQRCWQIHQPEQHDWALLSLEP
jgi:hypothetical protein